MSNTAEQALKRPQFGNRFLPKAGEDGNENGDIVFQHNAW